MDTNEREHANSPKINAYILELSKDYNDYKKMSIKENKIICLSFVHFCEQHM